MYLTKTAKGTSADKYLKKLLLYTAAVVPAPVLEMMAERRNGPSVYVHPNALIGGLGGGAVGSLGTYGVSRLTGSKTPVLNAYLGGLAGTVLGHALGGLSVR